MVKTVFLIGIAALLLISREQEPLEKTIPEIYVEESAAELKYHEGRLYFNGQTFSGYLTAVHGESVLAARIPYFDGKKHGLAQTWFPSGELCTARSYQAGKKGGLHRGFYEDGSPKFTYAFKNGEYHGEVLEWYASGDPAKAFSYQAGREVGKQQAWRENGKLYINIVVRENGKRYGLFNARPCYSVDDGAVAYADSGNEDDESTN